MTRLIIMGITTSKLDGFHNLFQFSFAFLSETRFPIMNKTHHHPILQTATTHHYIGRDYTTATP